MRVTVRALWCGAEAFLTAILMLVALTLFWPVALVRRKYLVH